MTHMVDKDGWHFTKKWEIHGEIWLSNGKSISRQRRNISSIRTHCYPFKSLFLENTLSTKGQAFLMADSIRLYTSKEKINKQEGCKAIVSMQDVKLTRNQLIMFCLNAHRRSMFRLSRRFHHTQIFSFLPPFSQTWIIYIGGYLHP